MNRRQKKKEELLNELSRRFEESAENLKSVARRINRAADKHHETVRRINRTGKPLRECVDGESTEIPFSYLEFVEFTNAEEFKKFKSVEVITDDEIKNVDIDSLCSKLLEG